MNKEVKYTKVFDLDAVNLKVSGTYDYLHNAPYFGFQAGASTWSCHGERVPIVHTIRRNQGE
jgi:hypothetical protein